MRDCATLRPAFAGLWGVVAEEDVLGIFPIVLETMLVGGGSPPLGQTLPFPKRRSEDIPASVTAKWPPLH
jgi:hypothetical protein